MDINFYAKPRLTGLVLIGFAILLNVIDIALFWSLQDLRNDFDVIIGDLFLGWAYYLSVYGEFSPGSAWGFVMAVVPNAAFYIGVVMLLHGVYGKGRHAAPAGEDRLHCAGCGSPLASDSLFCGECGKINWGVVRFELIFSVMIIPLAVLIRMYGDNNSQIIATVLFIIAIIASWNAIKATISSDTRW